jgi:enamine deaminase RidA (YjgF/YER057c/UK114 family)
VGHSVAVGNIVFGSGCTCGAAAPERVEEEVVLALECASRELEESGSTLGNVVKTFFLLTDLADYGAVRRIETEFYERHAPQLVTTPPAATLMVVPALAHPGHRVQYEVIAAVDRAAVTYYPEYWGGTELAYPHVPREHPKFARSQAIGDLLIVSGCQALDHGTVRVETDDVAAQSRIVLEKVRIAVEQAGLSPADIVKTNVFVKDRDALATYREVEAELFSSHSPASSAYVVAELPRPEFLVEVEAFAVSQGGELVFTPACPGEDLSRALRSLDDVLSRAGSSLQNVVKLTVATVDGFDGSALEPAVPREPTPATTLLRVTAIETPGARVQVDAVATRRRPTPTRRQTADL